MNCFLLIIIQRTQMMAAGSDGISYLFVSSVRSKRELVENIPFCFWFWPKSEKEMGEMPLDLMEVALLPNESSTSE